MIIMQSGIAVKSIGGGFLTVKQRILSLRLLEKQKKNPEIAKQVGIHVQMKEKSKHSTEKE